VGAGPSNINDYSIFKGKGRYSKKDAGPRCVSFPRNLTNEKPI